MFCLYAGDFLVADLKGGDRKRWQLGRERLSVPEESSLPSRVRNGKLAQICALSDPFICLLLTGGEKL